MELFVKQNGYIITGNVNDCCYRELCLKCDRAPRLGPETDKCRLGQ